jgi:fluoride exporter
VWLRLVLLVLGGGLGTVCRYGTGLLSARWAGTDFPWGTLAVNLGGCFLIGLAFSLADQRQIWGPSFRLFFVTGFLGGLTTFSAFGLESANFFRHGTLYSAVGNMLANNVGGLMLVLIGMWVGREI